MQKGSDSGMAHEEKATLRPIEMVVHTQTASQSSVYFLEPAVHLVHLWTAIISENIL